VAESRMVDDTFEMDIEVPVVGELMSVFRNDNLASNNWTFVESLLTTSPRMRLYTDTEGAPSRFYRIQPAFQLAPGEIGFIDNTCDLSTMSDSDSHNYYLRRENDHKDLQIHYKIPSRLEGQIEYVVFWIYKGDTGEIISSVAGAKQGDDFSAGNQIVTWTPELPSKENDPGFFIIQMEVAVGGEVVYKSPIADAVLDIPDWQCPQECLAIWDPLWRHRPILHLKPFSGGLDPGGLEYPIDPAVFVANAKLYQKLDNLQVLTLEHPTIADLSNYNTVNYFLEMGTVGVASRSGITSSEASPYIMHTANDHQFTNGAAGSGERRNHVNKEFLFAQYWLFYDFSNSAVDLLFTPYHEGDLEYVQIAIKKFNPVLPSRKRYWMEPFAATASQHYYGQTLRWYQTSGSTPISSQQIFEVIHDQRGRPSIFSAQGTHATYFAEGEYKVAVEFLGTQIQYDTPSLTTEIAVKSFPTFYQLAPMPSWFENWEGRWGHYHSTAGASFSATARNGPHGPLYRGAYEPPLFPDDPNSSQFPVNLRSNPVRFHNLSRKEYDGVRDLDLYIPES